MRHCCEPLPPLASLAIDSRDSRAATLHAAVVEMSLVFAREGFSVKSVEIAGPLNEGGTVNCAHGPVVVTLANEPTPNQGAPK